MSVYSLTCPTIGCYQNFQCDPEFQNKIIAVAYVKKSSALTPLDKANPTDWMDALMQKYYDGDAYLVFNVSGDKPKPETATTSGRGMQTTKTLAKTHTLNYMDMQGAVQSNTIWYNDIQAAGQNYDFYYFTPGRIWDASGFYVTVVGDTVITNEINTYMQTEVVVTWTSKVNPLPYDFDTSTFLEGLYYIIEGPSSTPPTTVFTCVPSTSPSIATGWTPVLNYSNTLVEDLSFVWSIQAGEDEVPAGLTLDAGGDLITESVATGTYNLVVAVTNQSGCIFGTLDFTITVETCG